MEVPTAQTNTPTSVKTNSKKPLLVVLVLVVLVTIGIGTFVLLDLQSKQTTEQVVTGLERDSIAIGMSAAAFKVFPNSESDTANTAFNSQIFDSLGKIVNGQIKPNLALNWTNPDKITWRFNLKKGIKFSNGTPLTANDIKYSIDTAIKENWPDAFNLSTVESVTVVDDFTVEIKTNFPDPVLFNRLAYVAIVSAKQFENIDNEPAVGTGPYKFVKGDDKEIVLEANENYLPNPPKIKKVTYKFFPDGTDEDLLLGLQQGEFDLAVLTDPKLSQSAETKFQVKALTDPFITFLWLDTDRDKSPYIDKAPNPLKNKLVRQAMYLAIQPQEMVKAANRSGEPASQLVTSAIFGFNPSISRPQRDIDKAKSLLKEAQLEDGFNLTLSVYKRIEKEGEALAKDLSEINIKTTLNVLSDDDFYGKAIGERDASAFLIDYGAETFDAGEIFTDVLHTPTDNFGGSNLTNYSNSEIDELADKIADTFDATTRKKAIQDGMVVAMSELPMLPLYVRNTFVIINKNFDWTPTAYGNIYPEEISGRQVINK